ncbi:hypothetical protein [Cellulomonas alba]|uniref:Uncharacterized protein n=1 Tax=Cellulomonas alba TaxID=3053467 RepID=A0ABT7SKE7_9CELL|nr:hypothetical protein [Cellulomonas alba]MDM7856663.1 hypothetical protein [Cellulomonas alba]
MIAAEIVRPVIASPDLLRYVVQDPNTRVVVALLGWVAGMICGACLALVLGR